MITLVPALLLGAAVGTGLWLLLAASVPAAPVNLSAVTRRDHQRPAQRSMQMLVDRIERCGHPWINPPTSDLSLEGWSTAGFLRHRLIWTGVATASGLALAAVAFIAGVTPPAAIVLVGLLVLAGAGALLPVWTLTDGAAHTREDYRRALAVFLELLAQERTAGRAPGPALRDAAEVGEHPLFGRIHTVVTRAHHLGHTPWHELRALGAELDLAELIDLADLANTAADGAAVYSSVRATAAALRNAAVSTDRADANARSERLTLPVCALMIGFLILAVYPTLAHLLNP